MNITASFHTRQIIIIFNGRWLVTRAFLLPRNIGSWLLQVLATDIAVNISVESRSILDRYIGRQSVDICRCASVCIKFSIEEPCEVSG